MKFGQATANASIEPEFTVYHKGTGFPTIQITAGLNSQWTKR